jgi:hypothetical protein
MIKMAATMGQKITKRTIGKELESCPRITRIESADLSPHSKELRVNPRNLRA